MAPKNLMTLTWGDFELAVAGMSKLAQQLAMEMGKGFSGIYGIPRGGLVLAVALSHRLNVPLSASPTSGCLVVDDVVETGRTIGKLVAGWGERNTIVWCNKSDRPCKAFIQVPRDAWIVFPWEDVSRASADAREYYKDRERDRVAEETVNASRQ